MKIVFLSSAMRLTANVFLLLYYSYEWNVEQFNDFVYFWSLGLVLGSLFDFGSTTKSLVSDYSVENVNQCFQLKVKLTSLFLVLVPIGFFIFPAWAVCLLLVLHVQTYFDFASAVLKKKNRYGYDLVCACLNYIPFLIVGGLFQSFPLEMICGVWLFFRLVVLMYIINKILPEMNNYGVFLKGTFQELKAGFQYFIEGFLAILAVNLDLILYSAILSSSAYYSYSIFNKYLVGINFFVVFLSQYFYSIFARSMHLRKMIKLAGTYYVGLGVLGAGLAYFIFGSGLLNSFFEGFFMDAVVLSLLSFSLFFRVLSALLALPIMIAGEVYTKNISSMISILIFIVGIYLVKQAETSWYFFAPILAASVYIFVSYLIICLVKATKKLGGVNESGIDLA